MLAMYLSLLETDEQRDKFERIYEKYKGLMYQVAFSVVKNHYLAEDVVHETFLNLIRIIDDVRTDDPRETAKFFKVITHNQAVDHIRKLDKSQAWSNDALERRMNKKSPDPETVAINRENYEHLVVSVSQMDELYRTPLMLRIQGYKVAEIADFLKMNPQTVKVRLHRARKILLAQLEDDSDGSQK